MAGILQNIEVVQCGTSRQSAGIRDKPLDGDAFASVALWASGHPHVWKIHPMSDGIPNLHQLGIDLVT
jgi:hypothetical protein